MTLSEERLAQLMAYCRIDVLAEGELALLETFFNAAVGYLDGAGVAAPAEGTARRGQYDLCVNYLVLDYYDHRDIPATNAAAAENPAFRHLINQLKLTDVPETGTSD